MTQVIIYPNDEGWLSVVTPASECGLTIDEIARKDVPAGKPYHIINADQLPTDNVFFNAWELQDGVVAVSLSKAKEITKDRLRMEREPLLAAQDVAFQRALETGADTTAIVAEKQRLRDITKLADSCTTTDELRNLKA